MTYYSKRHNAIISPSEGEKTRTGDGAWGVQYTFKINVDNAGAELRLFAEIANATGGGAGITSIGIFDGANQIGASLTHDQVGYSWKTGTFTAHGDAGDKEYTIKMSSNGTTVGKLRGIVIEFRD